MCVIPVGKRGSMRLQNKIQNIGLAAIVPTVLFVLWLIATRYEWFAVQLLVPPKLVFDTFITLLSKGELWVHIKASGIRVLIGFALGGSLGFILGIAMGLSKNIERYIGPFFHSLRQVPHLGWVPLLMIWFGIGEVFKVIFISIGVFYVVTLNTLEGIRGVSATYMEVARMFEYNRFDLLRRVILPAASPSIFTGIRLALSVSWMAVVGAELIASDTGLGFLMTWGRLLFQIDIVMVSIIIVGIIGLLMDLAMGFLERYCLRWRTVF